MQITRPRAWSVAALERQASQLRIKRLNDQKRQKKCFTASDKKLLEAIESELNRRAHPAGLSR